MLSIDVAQNMIWSISALMGVNDISIISLILDNVDTN